MQVRRSWMSGLAAISKRGGLGLGEREGSGEGVKEDAKRLTPAYRLVSVQRSQPS